MGGGGGYCIELIVQVLACDVYYSEPVELFRVLSVADIYEQLIVHDSALYIRWLIVEQHIVDGKIAVDIRTD